MYAKGIQEHSSTLWLNGKTSYGCNCPVWERVQSESEKTQKNAKSIIITCQTLIGEIGAESLTHADYWMQDQWCDKLKTGRKMKLADRKKHHARDMLML